MIPAATRGLSATPRDRVVKRLVEEGNGFGRRYDIASCEVASSIALRIGLGAGIERALYEIGEWWNGGGVPQALEGEAISAACRVARVAGDAAVLDDLGGPELAAHRLRERAGSVLDPNIVATFAANADGVLAKDGDPRDLMLEVEPEPVLEREHDDLRTVAAAFADVADLKFPALHGHSRGVAALAAGDARCLDLDARTIFDLEIAALLHDLGRLAVTNAIWEKPARLTSAEWEQVRLHAYHSERILATSQVLERLAPIAGMHHERLDGSGYHRCCDARDQPVTVRILAAADAFQAMTQDRPHRDALSPEEAAAELSRQVRAGLFDADCAAAVLEAAGQAAPTRRDLRPAGLTDREIEVLRLVAAGLSNPQITQQLVISRRTAEHHVQHIYGKLGVSSRPALALYAMEHDLL
jgi:HD-GYP domain-containing protein (c-di-GMP phosphodiesterase class II)